MRRIFIMTIILAACALPLAIATARLSKKITKPETAAQRLYSAYKSCNRAAALKAGSSRAVSKLFGKNCKPGDPKWQFMGCEKTGTTHLCSYYYEGGGVSMRVAGSASAGYTVRSVSFIAD